jgi:hypothetical protein
MENHPSQNRKWNSTYLFCTKASLDYYGFAPQINIGLCFAREKTNNINKKVLLLFIVESV